MLSFLRHAQKKKHLDLGSYTCMQSLSVRTSEKSVICPLAHLILLVILITQLYSVLSVKRNLMLMPLTRVFPVVECRLANEERRTAELQKRAASRNKNKKKST